MRIIVTRRSERGEASWAVETPDEVIDEIVRDLVAGGFDADAARAAASMLYTDSPPRTGTISGNTYSVEETVDPFSYPVELSQDDNDTVLVTFPDVPGGMTFGDDEEDALDHAVDALETMLLAYVLDRKDIPAPSPAHGRPTVRPTLLGTLKVMLYQAMRERGWRKADLARALRLDPRQVDRLLDLRHASTVKQLEQALTACGKRADVSVRELKAA
jgi:antitoxin HicB